MTTPEQVELALNGLISNLQIGDSKYVTYEREDMLAICKYIEALMAQNKLLVDVMKELGMS